MAIQLPELPLRRVTVVPSLSTAMTAPSYPALARNRTPSPLVPDTVATPVAVPVPPVPPPLVPPVFETLPRKSVCTKPARPAQVTGCQTPTADPREATDVPSARTVM